LAPLSNKSLAPIRARFENAAVFLVDEISMLNSFLFGCCDLRLQQIMGCDLPFGGLTMIVLGDFYQLPPIYPKALYKAVLMQLVQAVHNPNRLEVTGADLFATFKLVQFVQQMRAAEDQVHTDVIEAFRDPSIRIPVTAAVIRCLVFVFIEPT
jgi:hypothetical protein